MINNRKLLIFYDIFKYSTWFSFPPTSYVVFWWLAFSTISSQRLQLFDWFINYIEHMLQSKSWPFSLRCDFISTISFNHLDFIIDLFMNGFFSRVATGQFFPLNFSIQHSYKCNKLWHPPQNAISFRVLIFTMTEYITWTRSTQLKNTRFHFVFFFLFVEM